jgi:L-aminopeptidase/D-esterase-like protein
MAHDGLARTINPVHTQFDGDTIFGLSTGTLDLKVSAGTVGMIAAAVTAQAVVRAVTEAEGLPGVPSYRDLQK